MRTNTIMRFLLIAVIAASASACKKNLSPYDSKLVDAALNTPDGLQTATYGTYAGLVNADYTRFQHFLSEYPGDNVALSGTTTDPLYNVYNYTDFPGDNVTTSFWRQAYKVIYSANQIISRIKDGQSAQLDQLKGENLFLRAMAHFDLVRFFGRPYPQGEGANLGVVIKDNTIDDFPSRSTVAKVYDFVIADLQKAAALMTVPKKASFASKQAAYALLSRVYLFKEDNVNAINYADSVINSNRYQLLPTAAYQKYFTLSPDVNAETIFAIRHTVADNRGYAAIGAMYYNDPVTNATGWGEMYASLAFVNLLNKYPEDARHSFIELQLAPNGDTIKRGNVPKFYVNKYNWQEGVADLSSPVYLRLAEMYLIRAEANAKLGNNQLAIDDVNVIRQRAGLTGAALYTLSDLKGNATVLDVALEERRLELAFEGQRPGDLFRNNRPMIRAYPGFHSLDRFNQTINPTDARVIFLIPDTELKINPNLQPNL